MKRSAIPFLFVLSLSTLHGSASAAPDQAQVLAAMKKATHFMMDEVSNRGGFVWVYDLDLHPYGELKGRDSMIWVEPPSTPTAGMALLEAYKATGDSYYLEQSKKVANALVFGQHPSGGWHYFIDFDPSGTQAYYDSFFSKCWGWQEYLHYYGNCTFDDFVTSDSTRFLLRLYLTSLDPAYKQPLEKALGHTLRAQFPCGAWPQRFPLKPEHPTAGHPDYTDCYTFNDGVIGDNIRLLLEVYDSLGEDKYREAAIRGMDFYLLSQLPTPQAGWAQQYGHDLKPAWGRPFEMPGVCSSQTVENIDDLEFFYRVTGDRRYLEPIPRALDWLESAIIPDATDHTHACFYEVGSNRPLYTMQTGETIDNVKFETTYNREGVYPYSPKMTISIAPLRKKFEEVAALSPEEAKAALLKETEGEPLPKEKHGYYFYRVFQAIPQTPEGIAEVLANQDDRGGWVEDISLIDPYAPFSAPHHEFKGYTTGGYAARMYRMINYLGTLARER